MTPARLQELGLQRLDLLCAFMRYRLQEDSLAYATVLLSGYRSISGSALLRPHRHALAGLRVACHGLSTQAALRSAAARYNDQAAQSRAGHVHHFEIDEKTLRFRSSFDIPAQALAQALEELSLPRQREMHDRQLAAPLKEAFVSLAHEGEQRRYLLGGLPARPVPPVAHPVRSSRRETVSVPWDELLEHAREMDRIDLEGGAVRPGNWLKRLEGCRIALLSKDGQLTKCDHLELSALRHLIGLPGAGKTTLLVCLLRHLSTRELRTAVFFPSIEVCRSYVETLRRYRVNVGLLMGSSAKTRRQHAQRLAESIATDDDLRGFAKGSEVAGLFEGVCALPAMTQAPADAFGVQDRFCTKVLQAKAGESRPRFEERLCPVWSLCSSVRASRELPSSRVWAGHILSTDTAVPQHTTLWRERYFELIGREFDVVIFDEADRAQQDLDMTGLAQLQLSGFQSSFHADIQRHTLQVLAAGNNAILRNEEFAQLATDTAEFEKLNVALISAILRLDDTHRRELAGLLLTPLRLIGDKISPTRLSAIAADSQFQDPLARLKTALCSLWERSAIAAFQDRTLEVAEQTPDEEWGGMAEALQRPVETLLDDRRRLRRHLTLWLNAPSLRSRADEEAELTRLLRPMTRDMDDSSLRLLVQLLVPVTFTVLMYRRLSTRLTAMAQDGKVPHIKVDERCSDELLFSTPDNLLGSLSGVRYFSKPTIEGQESDRQAVQLQYVIFSGAPRMLMHRLAHWSLDRDGQSNGPAVLLTSATSFMPDSPASHVAVFPDYVLQATQRDDQVAPSRYVFRPIPDPASQSGACLRFSGERSEQQRMRNLEKMAHALLDGGPLSSQLAADCASFDVREGISRKAALIVNSYDQAVALKRYIDNRLPAWRGRTVAVVRTFPQGGAAHGYVTAATSEGLGDRDDWDILIFPMGALGRGTNVVFSKGARNRDATLGSLYFLTRPHPSPEDLSFLVSLAAEASQEFDAKDLSGLNELEELSKALQSARGRAYKRIGRLLRHPLYARSLGDLFQPFSANMAVPLLQTIGRAMRNGCPAQCFFVDRAWAERSAIGEPDQAATSMLLQIRLLLEQGLRSSDSRKATLYRELYSAFYDPLSRMEGLLVADGLSSSSPEDDDWTENPIWRLDGLGPGEGD